ncbi:MAG: LIC_13355 family lipoprotein [Spirochaetia bacterium]|nr:LIC_13355 family lipoprotein [Spirochaetia bacterium]
MMAPFLNTWARLALGAICVGLLPLLTACPAGTPSDGAGLAMAALLAGSASNQSRPCAGYTASTPTGTAAADTVTSAPGSTGFGNSDSYCAVNGIRGAGLLEGSLDVYTLSSTGSGASIVLEWAGQKVTNGAGVDFVVFENPFRISGSATNVFLEAIVVEVSRDKSTYCGWNPSYTGGGTYSGDPANWIRFAGITPVLYNQATNPLNAVDVMDTSKAGGDAFDLGDANFGSSGYLCDATAKSDIQTNGFYYLKLTAATASPYNKPASSASSDGPDIDGVVARNLAARP